MSDQIEHESIKSIRIGNREVTLRGDVSDSYFSNIIDNNWMNRHLDAYVRSNVKRDAVCFDIGANIGLTAILLSDWCSSGHVFAFEASPRNVENLRHNLAANGITNCTVVPCAVGSESGRLQFALANLAASSHVVADGMEVQAGATLVDVPVTRIDDFMSSVPDVSRLDFIKIDVEGHESHALYGASNTISKYRPPIFAEFNSWSLLKTQNISPFLFAAALWRCADVMSVAEDGTTRPAAEGSLDNFLFENLVNHGTLDDILLLPRADADWSLLANVDAGPKQWRRKQAELQSVYKSKAGRIPALLRAIRRVAG